jgi:hypothetical protein
MLTKLPTPLLFFAFTVALLTGCEPLKKKCSRSYEVDHPVSVYPIKESYLIGDTIWFEMRKTKISLLISFGFVLLYSCAIHIVN